MAVLSSTSPLSFTLDALASQLVTPEEVGLNLSDSDLAEIKHARQSHQERELTELTRSGFRLPALHRRPTLELTTRGPHPIKAARLPALHLQHGGSGDDDDVNTTSAISDLPVKTVEPSVGPESEIRRCLTEIIITSATLEEDASLGCDNMTDQRIIKLLHWVNEILAALEKIEAPAKHLDGKMDATLLAQMTQYVGTAQKQIMHALMHLGFDYELAADLAHEEDLAKLVLNMDHRLDSLKTHKSIHLRNWYTVLQMLFLHPFLEKLSYSRRPASVAKPVWATYQSGLDAATRFKKTLMGAHQEGGADEEHTQLDPSFLYPLLTDLGQTLTQMTDVIKSLSEMPNNPKNAEDKTDILIALRFLFTQSLQHDIPHFLSHFNQEFSSTEDESVEAWLAAVSSVQEGLTLLSASPLFVGTSQEEQLEPWCAKIVSDLVQPVYLRLFNAQMGSYTKNIGET